MNPQTFNINTGQGQKASYKLVIPVINNDDSCRLEIRDSNNSTLKYTQGDENVFILERNDTIGEYIFLISLYDSKDAKSGKLISQQNVTVNILGSLSEPDLKLAEENHKLVLECVKQVTVESGAGMGGAWIKGMNMPAAWRKLNQQLNGHEVVFLCNILEESHDFKIYWVTMNFLNFSSQEVTDSTLLARILSAASDHLPNGGHVQTIALQLIQSLELPKSVVWKALISSLRVTAPNMSMPIIKIIVLFIPEDGIKPTGNAILRVIKSLNPDSYEILQCLSAIEDINFREAAVSLHDILIRSGNPQASAKIAGLLYKWKDNEAASSIRKYLDNNHATVGHLLILDTMRTLYRIEGDSSLTYISQLLLKCHPYVQQNLAGEYLGELRYEPVILNTMKELISRTNDPNIRKSLTDFIEKNSKK